jgi:phosphatidylcholine synthase
VFRRPADGGRWLAWLIHVFTALGLVAGVAALLAVFDGHARAAISWLLVAAVIDGVDGPLARAFGVAETLPRIDGAVLDTVVDFVGCVVGPFAFLWRFGMLPHELAFLLVGVGFVTSALWYSRTDMMTEDNWFNGFPAAWNLAVPTMFLLHDSTTVNAVLVIGLCVLQLSSVKFVHPVRVADGQALNMAMTMLWLAAIAAMTELAPQLPLGGRILLLLGPVHQVLITSRRTLRRPSASAAAAVLD